MSSTYYSRRLSGERLEVCYEVAPPRVQQYLDAEIDHVLTLIPYDARVLELGCGYGRVLERLAPDSRLACGIDTSIDSLRLAKRRLATVPNVVVAVMDAVRPALAAASFDVVCCLQNGISAFHVEQRQLVAAAVRLAEHAGKVIFSSYADDFWEHRLEWFRIQARHGLVGEIDESATSDGNIICKDGFSASTVSPEQFRILATGCGKHVSVEVVDRSSVFCVMS